MIKFLRFYLPAFLLVLLVHLSASAQNCTINAGSDRTICAGQPFILNGNATGLFNQQATWTQVSGPAVTVSSTTVSGGNAIATVTGFTSGVNYTFRLSAKCTDGSPVFDDAVYNVSTLTVSNAGPAITSCPGVVTMAANTVKPGETGSWSVVSGNLPVPSPATSPTATVTLPQTGNTIGTTIYRWTITGSTGSCSSTSDVAVTNLGGEPIFVNTPLYVNCYSVVATTGLHASFAGSGNGQIGTWSFISGPSVPTFGDIHDSNTGIGNLTGGVYVVRWTVTGPCVSGARDVTITVDNPSQSITNAGGDPFFTYCDGRTTTALNGVKPLYANEVVQWTSASSNPTAVTFSNPTSPTTTVMGLDGHSAYDLIYTITNTITGCTSVGTYHVRYTTPPAITINADTPSPSILACGASQLNIHYNVVGGNRTQWALVSAPAGSNIEANFGINHFVTASDDFQLIVGMDKIGTYIIRFRRYNDDASGGCVDSYIDLPIVISKAPYQANAGTSQFLACGVTSATLAGNGPQAGDSGIGQWTQVSGPNSAIIADRSLNTTGISGLISGVYTIRWIVTGGGKDCGDSQSDVKVVISATPSTPNAGADIATCFATPLKLDANQPLANETGTWTVVSETPGTPASNITFSSVNDPHAIVSGLLANKTYVLRWTISSACGSLSDDVNVNTNATNGPKQAVAGADQCLASGTTSFALNGNALSAGETGTWTLLPGSPNTPAFNNNNSQTVTGAVNGTYKFEWKLDRGGCGSTRDTVVITISPATTTAAINGTPSQDVCGLGPITLTATSAPTAMETGTWTQVAGPGGATITSPGSTSTTVTGLVQGRYKFRYTITNSACGSSFAEITYNISEPPTPANAAVGGITTISLCDAASTTLDANPITVGSGLWVVKSGPGTPVFSSLTDPKATISGLMLGTYVLTWRSSNGTICPPSTSDVTITLHQSANAGADQNLCNTNITILSGNEGSDGTWTMISALPAGTPPVTISKNGSSTGFGNTAIVSGLTPNANYVFRYTINTGIVAGKDAGGCGTLTDDMAVAVSGPPSTADAGPDQQICTSTTTQVTLAAAAPTVGTGSWTIISRPLGSVLTLSSTTNNHAVLANLTVPGDYLLQWTVTNANCTGDQSSNDIVRISVYDPPTTAAPMTNQPSACAGGVTLTGTTPTVGIGTWTFVPNGGGDTRTPVIDAPNSPVTAVSGLVVDPANPYRFRWTISNGVCTSSSADVLITVTDNSPAVANAGTVANTCAATAGGTAAVTLASTNTTLTGNDQGTWSVVVQPASSPVVTFNNIHSPTAVAGNLVAGAYTLKWTITNNSSCSSTSNVSFTILDPPSTADAGPPTANYCLASTIALAAVTPGAGTTGTWSVIAKPTGAADPTFSSIHDNNATLTGVVAGNYTFRWTTSNGQCTDSFDDITITVADCNINLSITNTDNKLTYTPGTTNTYVLVASNSGTNAANGATVTFPFPTGVTGTWTATYTGGATGTAGGAGAINQTVNMPAGSTVTYTVTAAVASSVTGALTTTATIIPPAGIADQNPSDNTASDQDNQSSLADLAITNTDGSPTYTPGTTSTYTVVGSNTGSSDANGSTVTYPLPSGITGSWTAVYTGGATGAASGTGSINESVNLPVGGTITYTVTAVIPSGTTGVLTTTATITPPAGVTDNNTLNNTAIDNDNQNSRADLIVTNTDGKLNYTPGTPNGYTIVVTNAGPSDVTGANVNNNLPAGATGSWTAVYTGGATGNTSGTGNINELVNMPTGSTITYTYVVNVPANATGTFTNTTTVSVPAGVTDVNLANNTSSDPDAQNSVTDLKITKTASVSSPSLNTQVTFTLTAVNNGPSYASNVTVTDVLPSGFAFVSVTPSVGTYTTGTGIWAIGNLTNSGTATLTMVARVNATGNYTNTATIAGAETDNDATNNTGLVTITPKQLPVANNDNGTASTSAPAVINLLGNDTKANDNLMPNTVTIVTPPQHGTVTIDPSTGVATYRPNAGYTGPDSFTYTVSDANGGTSNVATVTLNVVKAPVANDDSAVTNVNTPVTINMPVNDTNGAAPIAPSTVAIVQQPLHGTVTVNPTTGVATYTPNAGYFGNDNFTYTIKDQNGIVSNVANVTITIPKGPTATDDNAATTPNRPVGIPVIDNDTPGTSDLDPTTVTIITPPAHGTLIVDPVTGLVTYTPALNYAGPDQFTYTIKDKNGATSNVATVKINTTDKPVIGLAKAVASSTKAINGSYDVRYILTVGNYGITDLNNISIKDDLTQTFKGEQVVLKSIRTLGGLVVNQNYNGSSNIEMLAAGNHLYTGAVEQIEIVANVTVVTGGATYLNRATASGVSITGAATTDQSTDGLKPDVTAKGDVSSSTPTPVDLTRPNGFIPSGFSPNGDGVHDTFVIENVSGRKVSLEFYNRWGNLVYRNADYQNDWGGKCNQGIHIGEDLPEGTYYYIVNFDGKDRYVGFITLNR